jgi:hypothetical protein
MVGDPMSAPWEAPDELAVTLVVVDHHRMPLVGPDRTEAIRRLAEQGYQAEEIAQRLRMRSAMSVRRWARQHGVRLPGKRPAHWTVEYVEKRQTPANRRKWKNGEF